MVESRFPAEAGPMLRDVERCANPWGKPQTERAAWAERARRARARARRPAARGPLLGRLRGRRSTSGPARPPRSTAKLLQAAGVDFAILGPRECCTGDPARRMGDEYTFQSYAQQNVETLNEAGVTRIVTSCPHCFNTLAQRVPGLRRPLRGRAPHRAAGGARARRAARPAGRRPRDHVPRLVLPGPPQRRARGAARAGRRRRAAGRDGTKRQANVLLRRRRRAHVDGGARRPINEERVREAAETGAGTLAVACPFCTVMLDDGVQADRRASCASPTSDVLLAEAARENGPRRIDVHRPSSVADLHSWNDRSTSDIARGTQSIDRAAQLLVHVVETDEPPTVGELAARLGLPKSTTSRLVGALERQGLDPARRPARGALVPGAGAAAATRRRETGDPELVDVRRGRARPARGESGETINLGVPSLGAVEQLDQRDSRTSSARRTGSAAASRPRLGAREGVSRAAARCRLPTGPLERLTPRDDRRPAAGRASASRPYAAAATRPRSTSSSPASGPSRRRFATRTARSSRRSASPARPSGCARAVGRGSGELIDARGPRRLRPPRPRRSKARCRMSDDEHRSPLSHRRRTSSSRCTTTSTTGSRDEIIEGTEILLERGWSAEKVLNDALVEGMRIVGIDFRDGILFVPEVLLAANAMKAGMEVLRPLLAETGADADGQGRDRHRQGRHPRHRQEPRRDDARGRRLRGRSTSGSTTPSRTTSPRSRSTSRTSSECRRS